MAIDPSISLNVKPVDLTGSLKSMLDIQNMKQQLAANKINLNIAGQTQDAAIAQKNAESNLAVNTVQPRIQQQETQAESSKYALSKDQINYAQQLAGGLIQDNRIISGDPEKQTQALNETEDKLQSSGLSQVQVKSMMAPYYLMAAHSPGQLQNLIKTSITQNQSAEGQAAYNTVPVSNKNQLGTDVVGNPYVVSKDNYGRISAMGLPVQGSNPPPSPVTNLSIEDKQNIPVYTEELRTLPDKASSAMSSKDLNNSVISKLNDFTSGHGSQALSKMSGSVLSEWLGGSKYGTTAGEIKHNLAVNNAEGLTQMGHKTDAGQQLQSLKGGDIDMTTDALATNLKLNNAINQGVIDYNKGAQNSYIAAAKENPQTAPLALKTFKQKWATNWSPDVSRLQNAINSGDKKEMDDISKIHGGANSPEMQALIARARVIDSLTGNQ